MFTRSLARTVQRCRSAVTASGPAGTLFRGGPAVALPSCRAAHTDLAVPDFSAYRSPHTEKANERTAGSDMARKAAGYVVLGGMYKYYSI